MPFFLGLMLVTALAVLAPMFAVVAVAFMPAPPAFAFEGKNQGLGQFMLALVNRDRQQAGSETLVESPRLSRLAQDYAEYMLRNGSFAHVDPAGRNPQDRAALHGINVRVSENLAWQMSNFEEPEILIKRAQASMMAEPPNEMNHRYNILNPRSRFIGIGVARQGDKIMIVQEFSEQVP